MGLFELRSREIVPALPPATLKEMRNIAGKLRELAPDLGVTHCALSYVSYYEFDFPKALEHAEHSVKADPDYEFGHVWFGYMLAHWDRPKEARKEIEIARRIAPSKATVYRAFGHSYYAERDFTNAIAMYREAIRWQSRHFPAIWYTGCAYLALGDHMKGVSYFEQHAILSGADEAQTKARWASSREAFQEGGVRGYWQDEWNRAERSLNNDFYRKGVVQIHLGDTNAALNWLNKSYEAHECWPGSFARCVEKLVFDEHWDGVRDDPRFKALLDKIGFTKVMGSR